jgi:hypothetical protein
MNATETARTPEHQRRIAEAKRALAMLRDGKLRLDANFDPEHPYKDYDPAQPYISDDLEAELKKGKLVEL